MQKRETFYGVAHSSQTLYGLKAEQATLDWWNAQGEDAKKVLSDPAAMDLPLLLVKFGAWLATFDDVKVWGNGADFDLPILGAAYVACGLPVPWKPYNGRCYRTLKNLAPQIKLQREGAHHNALDDAISQATHLENIVNTLGVTLG
jgi:hypothetical protein